MEKEKADLDDDVLEKVSGGSDSGAMPSDTYLWVAIDNVCPNCTFPVRLISKSDGREEYECTQCPCKYYFATQP